MEKISILLPELFETEDKLVRYLWGIEVFEVEANRLGETCELGCCGW